MLRVLLSAFLLFFVAPANAQFLPNFDRATAEAAFEDGAKGHVLNVQRVGVIRGMPQQIATTITVESVVKVLARADPTSGYFPNTRLLFYASDNGELRIWLIDRTGLLAASRTAMTPEQLAEASKNLRLSLDVDGIARGRAVRLRNAVRPQPSLRKSLELDINKLSSLLIPKPISAALKNSDHVLVIGGGDITSVPFALLRLDANTMLIDKMTVSVSPGLYDFAQPVTHWNGKDALSHPLIVGNPTVFPSSKWDVPSLPGAEKEANDFAKLVGGRALIGPLARKDAILRDFDSASILYFAAHGVASPEDPIGGGFLMLAGDDEEGGFLRAGEVQRRRLRAALVVLSACQSGLGMPHQGGMIGLTRAFRSAGAPRVAMTLWSVSDDATAVLMDKFQHNLVTDMPASALRKAMLETREVFPEPRYWAAFALYGTPR